jgi:hypothetical protein
VGAVPRTSALLAVAFLAVALAGCADGGSDDTTAPGPASSASSSTTGPPPKPVVTSDTLHLLAAPEMALMLPEGSQESETGTAGDFGGPGGGGGGQEPPATWRFQVRANSTVTTAEIRVWIDVRDTLLQPVDPRTPQDTCTWFVLLELGSDGSQDRACLAEPPGPINPGTKELIFELVGLDAELEVNETVMFRFTRRAFSASADDSVFVLSGSTDHDSRLVLKGLKEPVPDA